MEMGGNGWEGTGGRDGGSGVERGVGGWHLPLLLFKYHFRVTPEETMRESYLLCAGTEDHVFLELTYNSTFSLLELSSYFCYFFKHQEALIIDAKF